MTRPVPRLVAAAGLAALVLLLPCADPAGAQAVRYQAKLSTINKVGLTVTNYGFLGNNFASRAPSFEYPLGEGYEHMSRAGLWVGARAVSDSGEVLRVSHGVVDNAQGSSQATDTEFTPTTDPIVERSRIVTSKFFDRSAVSDQDLVARFTDRPARSATSATSEDHVPIGIDVTLSSYAFGLEAAADFVVLSFTIRNDGPPLRDAWVGLYTQLVSGDKSAYSTWPPSSTSGPGSWYYKKYMTWVDSLSMVAEHYCAAVTVLPDGQPDPVACDFDYAPPWAASKFLGVRAGTLVVPDSLRLSVRFWNYEPGDSTRDQDVERYALMAQPGVDDPSPLWAGMGASVSPIEVISVGPFPEIPPDSTITVDFALLGGESWEDLHRHAAFAQFAFEQNYRLPSPPPSPRLHVRARDGALELLWDDVAERTPDETSPAPGGIDFQGYRVYVGRDRTRPALVAQFDLADSTGFNTGLEPIRLPEPVIEGGDTLRYIHRVSSLKSGFTYYAAVTSFDTGDAQIASLESGIGQNKTLAVPLAGPGERSDGVTVFPNPYKVDAQWDAGSLVRDHYLWFANLPQRARLRVWTVGGDLVFETEFDGATYDGSSARGLYDPKSDVDVQDTALSGASYAWNLISNRGQAIASGLYLWTVEDHDTGRTERGKFLVVKSDREGF